MYDAGFRPRTTRYFRFGESTQSHIAPRLTYRDVLMPRAHGCAGAAFGRIVSVSGLRRSAFPSLACKSGACRPWQARSAGRRFTGPSPLSASPLPGPLSGPRFGFTHPRLDRRGQKMQKRTTPARFHAVRSVSLRYHRSGNQAPPGTDAGRLLWRRITLDKRLLSSA